MTGTDQDPVALFIHGVFLSADLWAGQLDTLGDLRRCVAVDLLGHGASACPPPGSMTLPGQADMILSLLDALGAEQADLVANDSGGAIAQLVAVKAPHRIRSLTLTDCDTDENLPPAEFAPIVELARSGVLAPTMPAIAADPKAGRDALASGLEQPDALPDEVISGFLAPFADPARAQAVEAMVASMDPAVLVPIRAGLARLQAPTLLVWGTADQFFGVSWARWLADTIPGARPVRFLEGAKLFHPLERPAELSQALREFWTT
ncbi:MAG TPA: alpha/beta hydrolase [Streptosporangiaceae bacterium]|nr:alpha/beta hydrolase [Streptosporangiaceae bacterium]